MGDEVFWPEYGQNVRLTCCQGGKLECLDVMPGILIGAWRTDKGTLKNRLCCWAGTEGTDKGSERLCKEGGTMCCRKPDAESTAEFTFDVVAGRCESRASGCGVFYRGDAPAGMLIFKCSDLAVRVS